MVTCLCNVVIIEQCVHSPIRLPARLDGLTQAMTSRTAQVRGFWEPTGCFWNSARIVIKTTCSDSLPLLRLA